MMVAGRQLLAAGPEYASTKATAKPKLARVAIRGHLEADYSACLTGHPR